MSQDPKTRKALARRPPDPRYEVGYGKPPVDTRFKPGRSGNPSGRPRGSKNKTRLPGLEEERLKTIILEEAYRSVTVNDGTRQVQIPMAQAVMRSLAVNAAKGHQRSQRLFTQLLHGTETAHKKLHDQWMETAIGYKVDWEREIERCRKLGLPIPDPRPHPDDIIIDMRTGTARIKGPWTKEDKKDWDKLRRCKADYLAEITELQEWLKNEPDTPYRQQIESDIEHHKTLVAMISNVIPD